jgi:hypothetical protein
MNRTDARFTRPLQSVEDIPNRGVRESLASIRTTIMSVRAFSAKILDCGGKSDATPLSHQGSFRAENLRPPLKAAWRCASRRSP